MGDKNLVKPENLTLEQVTQYALPFGLLGEEVLSRINDEAHLIERFRYGEKPIFQNQTYNPEVFHFLIKALQTEPLGGAQFNTKQECYDGKYGHTLATAEIMVGKPMSDAIGCFASTNNDVTVDLYSLRAIGKETKEEILETFGLFGFSYEDGRLIPLPIIEKWMMPSIRMSRGPFEESPLGKFVGGKTPFLHSGGTHGFGYTIDYGRPSEGFFADKSTVGQSFWNYDSLPTAERSRKTELKDYEYNIILHVDPQRQSAALIIESVDGEGKHGNPVLFDLFIYNHSALSNAHRLNFSHFLHNLPSYLLKGIEDSGLRFSQQCIENLKEYVERGNPAETLFQKLLE